MTISCVGEWFFFMRSSENEFFRSWGPLGSKDVNDCRYVFPCAGALPTCYRIGCLGSPIRNRTRRGSEVHNLRWPDSHESIRRRARIACFERSEFSLESLHCHAFRMKVVHLDGPIRANRFADSRESPDSGESFQGSRTEPLFYESRFGAPSL